ncbi:hypothetical protein S1OALGB6SA_1774 [Olavius algarvensis spirochete endosymbiont]|uniref:nucleoside-triphosphatase n=1 Tax=Olavius algarvensis spirochete endosymbiont TaxID=260710 RepID=UPI000F11028B|nr:nucleoside-triphosphatase [Olavius algarvensis spirochete endosymbiont]VDB00690.1 hypothetical protein S1OALGB6SA_1774 [Olavius algarvensis spirochete endosymbiont]
MIYLICGEKNEGKTVRLKQIFLTVRNAYGFAAEKMFKGGSLVAYNLVNLRNGDSILLAQIRIEPDGCVAESFAYGPFCVNAAAFVWAEEIFEAAQTAEADAFFFDEIGRIELSARGYSKLMRTALESDMDIYMTVRNANIVDVIREFRIKEYVQIRAR